MDVHAPSPQTTLLIVLGASAWLFSPEFQSSEAFAHAARRLEAYFKVVAENLRRKDAVRRIHLLSRQDEGGNP